MEHSKVYLLINGNDLVVVDTGTPGNAEKIGDYIQKIGHQTTEVSTIILTHYHVDHAGSAKDLKDLSSTKVASHQNDADFVAGKKLKWVNGISEISIINLNDLISDT